MTQIQDLRIGNLLWFKDQEVATKVVELHEDKFVCEKGWRLGASHFEGIPLTGKILLDSGFETRGFTFSFEIEKGKYFNVLLGDIENWFTLHIADIDYYIPYHNTKHVHDLQNAFYMALGQQLNIAIK